MSIAQHTKANGLRAGKRVLMSRKSTMTKLIVGCVLMTGLTACETRTDRAVKVGNMLITNPKGNHPIRVSKQMIEMKIPVRRGDYGLNAEKKMELASFINRYRREGEGRLVLAAPSGQPNEVAVVDVLNDVRDNMKGQGVVRAMVKLRPYSPKGEPEAPIIISFLGYKATGPKCGALTRDMGSERDNLPGENFSCANQANFAAMIANPKDLIEPRDMTPRSGERRDSQWSKFVKGKYMGREKSKEQKQTLGSAVGG